MSSPYKPFSRNAFTIRSPKTFLVFLDHTSDTVADMISSICTARLRGTRYRPSLAPYRPLPGFTPV